MADGKGSISEKPTGVQPSGSQATLAASMPEQTERYFMVADLLSPRTPYASTVKVLHLDTPAVEEA